MSIADVLIMIFIVYGALVGFKQGFTRSLVSFLGVVFVIVLAFLFKNPISEILMKTFPFFPFGGLIKGVTVLNIVLYEVIAFAFMFSVLMIVLKILSKTTSIFEKVLAFTIVLGIPSKILGLIVGAIKNYVIVFFILYFLTMPNFSELSMVNDSEFKDSILRNTPLLSGVASNTLNVVDEFKELTKKYEYMDDNNQFNLETLDLFLKYKVTTPKVVRQLQNDGKINITGIDDVLKKYEE